MQVIASRMERNTKKNEESTREREKQKGKNENGDLEK